MSTPSSIGFLGAGQMATALAVGWRTAGLLEPSHCLASDPVPVARTTFTARTGIDAVADNVQVVEKGSILILAVKPQTLPELLREIQPLLKPMQLVISIAAGVTLKQLAAGLGSSCRIIRVMPNTPCLVGASASGYSAGPVATPEDCELVEKLFSSVGLAVAVPEKLLDAVTGLSGSGPAFVAVMIEALADGGVKMGLPRSTALQLAAQTVLGTAKMILQTGQHPGQLKDSVASPGGTTIAGLHALETGAVRAAFINAVEAATKRAEELGK
jgi:pyrroline-5-carboxylate reductase